MAAPRREKDPRRTIKAHQKTMGSLGIAAGWTNVEVDGTKFSVRADSKGNPNKEQRVGPGKDSAFAPGKSSALRFSTEEASAASFKGL